MVLRCLPATSFQWDFNTPKITGREYIYFARLWQSHINFARLQSG